MSYNGLEENLVPASYFQQGGLWACGYNLTYGALGDNTTVTKSSPVQTIAGGTNWNLISGGNYHAGGIKTDGTLWIWGNNSGQLGDNTTVTKSSPVQTIAGGTNWKQISCGYYMTAAIKTDGTLWTWGLNNSGVLGNNTSTDQSSPIQTIDAGTNWKQVSTGLSATAAGIKTDGTLWTWGQNTYGQLGNNNLTAQSSPVQTVAGGTNWKYVSVGNLCVGAIKTDGTLWTWGFNGFGKLGNNNSSPRSSPAQTVAGGTNWKQVSGGSGMMTAIKTDGTLWTWGQNTYGQLGDNTSVDKSSPVQTIDAGTNWKQVECGLDFMAAIKTDGTLWTWGRNSGQLGDNTLLNKSSPAQTVAGGTNWKKVDCGNLALYAINQTWGTIT